MRTAWIFFAVMAAFLLGLFLQIHVWVRGDTMDIHIHDTYFVFAHFYFMVLLVLATAFFLGGTIGTRMKNKYFLILFLVLMAVDLFIIIRMAIVLRNPTIVK